MWQPATNIGIVYDRATGAVKRVINPDYEEQLDQHFIADDEVLRRIKKADHGIAGHMTLEQLHRLLGAV